MFLDSGDPCLSFCSSCPSLKIIPGLCSTERLSLERQLSSHYKKGSENSIQAGSNTEFIMKATYYIKLLVSLKKKKLLLNNHRCDSPLEYLLL